MKNYFKIIYLFFSLLFVIYIVLPTNGFPEPPPDSIQSQEPADTETALRRAYFTNFNRAEVMDYYAQQFAKMSLFGFSVSIPGIRLNYPPEDSQTLIRDQTRTSFLEELVHPLRESVYINGFVPTQPKDDIWYEGKHFTQKIIIKYSYTGLIVRLAVTLAALTAFYFVTIQFCKTLMVSMRLIKKRK